MRVEVLAPNELRDGEHGFMAVCKYHSSMTSTTFKAAKLIIIQSLKPTERPTGEELAHALRMHSFGSDLPPIELVKCPTKTDFVRTLSVIEQGAADGEIPIVHIECHGSADTGIHFADDENMPWDTLAASLGQLNRQTDFNLLVVISACFGAYFQRYMPPVRVSPCWGIVAPTQTAHPLELEQGFISFYKSLFDDLDLTKAMRLLRETPLSNGAWHVAIAEWWFKTAITMYYERHCLASDKEERIRGVIEQREANAEPWASRKDIDRFLKIKNRGAVDRYFGIYFDTEALPDNVARFAAVKNELDREVEAMAASGNYHL